MTDASAARLDAFTDAAFAFAVTLLLVGGGQPDAAALNQLLASIPAFAIGFAIIAMFWLGHVRWRRVRGAGDWRSLLLTLVLVFVVLIYVVPLRAMAASFAGYLGAGGGFNGGIGELFAVYGAGFVAMATTMALLFGDALRNPELAERRAVRGEMVIWLILAATGLVSVTLAALAPMAAPWAYATLPLSIGLFAARWNWDETQGEGTA